MILVTGAGGTVGTQLLEALTRANIPFKAAFHTPEKAERARRDGLQACVVDLARPETLRPALADVSRLFLLSVAGPDLAAWEGGAAQEAARAGVRHIVKLSVWRASEEEYTLARWHRAAEKAIEACGVPFTFLRPNSFMQNFVTYHLQALRAGSLALPARAAKVSHVDVRDVAEVAARVLTEDSHAAHAYDLSGPESLSYAQATHILSVAWGRKIAYVEAADSDFLRGMAEQGIPEWFAQAIVDLHAYARRGQAADVLGSVPQMTQRRAIPLLRFAQDHAARFLGQTEAS